MHYLRGPLGVPRDSDGPDRFPDYYDWQEPKPFYVATMEFKEYKDDWSSKFFCWMDRTTDFWYPMFEKDIVAVLKNGVYHGGLVHDAIWEVYKSGKHYGIRIYKEYE